MRKILALLLICSLMIPSLVACSGENENPTDTPGENSGTYTPPNGDHIVEIPPRSPYHIDVDVPEKICTSGESITVSVSYGSECTPPESLKFIITFIIPMLRTKS